MLSWDPIPEWQVAGILRSFHITYRQLDTADNTTYNITVPITNLTVEIANLQEYTNYSLEIKGVTKFVGAATEPIIVTTDEDSTSDILFHCYNFTMGKIIFCLASFTQSESRLQEITENAFWLERLLGNVA